MTLGPGGEMRSWSRPGTNPCRDLCLPDWALARMRRLLPPDVHDELARRLAASVPVGRYQVSTGDRILAMSYAKQGLPFVEIAERVAQFPPDVRYEARGYAVVHESILYRFVRIAACGNWALIVAPLVVTPEGAWSDAPSFLSVPGIGGVLLGGGGAVGGAGTVLAQLAAGGPQRQEIVTSVPTPGAFLLLGSALATLCAPRLFLRQERWSPRSGQ